MINRKLGNVHALSVLPTFTRASTAYKEDGTVVQAGVPRIESAGLKVEEGTTNLMTSANSQSISSVVSVTVASGSVYSVSCKTGSITLSGAGSGTVTSTTSITFTASTTTLTLTPATTATYNQVELKAYSTSWQMGKVERTPQEQLAIPASTLDYREGTIEFDYTPINQPLSAIISQLTSPKIMQIGNYGDINSLSLWYFVHAGNLDMSLYGNKINASWNLLGNHTYTFNLNSKYRMALRWKTANTFGVLVNGIPIIKNAVSTVPFTAMGNIILGNTSVSGGVNAIYSNVRVSNKWRTDIELAYTGDLAVDYYTTYLLPCKTSITPKNF